MAVVINQGEEYLIQQIEKNFPDQFKIIMELIDSNINKALQQLSPENCEKTIRFLRLHYVNDALDSSDISSPLTCNIKTNLNLQVPSPVFQP
jgi:hypothetical protein